MAIKAENKRVSVVMDERDQQLYALQEMRDKADYRLTTATSYYRGCVLKANYADWTMKPVEAMDMNELALFVATWDMGISCGSDDNGMFPNSTSATDTKAYEKAIVRLMEKLSRL